MKRLRRHTTPDHGSILNADCDVRQITTTTRPSLHSSLQASIQRREKVNSMNVSTSQTFQGTAEEIYTQLRSFLHQHRDTINPALHNIIEQSDVARAFDTEETKSHDVGNKRWTIRMVVDLNKENAILVSISSEDLAK